MLTNTIKMEEQKTKTIKITINGQSFEIPMDMSVLQGFMQQMAPKQAREQSVANIKQVLGLPQIQSSHRRLEDDFFGLIHEDMDLLRGFGMFNRDERISRALIALHNRLRKLEDCCFAPEKPAKKEAKPKVKKAKKQVSKQVSEKPTKKPRK